MRATNTNFILHHPITDTPTQYMHSISTFTYTILFHFSLVSICQKHVHKIKIISQKYRNMSGLHRRLLDGSTRQLAVPNASNSDETVSTSEQVIGGSTIGSGVASNISNSTSSLTSSTTNASISNQSSCVATPSSISTPLATTFLSSAGGHPLAPSSCLVMRRPSTNTFVTTFVSISLCFSYFCFYHSLSNSNFVALHIFELVSFLNSHAMNVKHQLKCFFNLI